ncbi:MAG: ATP-grasp domain-containing protein [Anaerolineae bacterium]|nr:MAG: ATP-grasp domain-containing protein [Anaerolineae bacterium]
MSPTRPEAPPSRVLLLMATKTYRAGAFLEAASRLGIPVAVGSEETHVLSGLNPRGNLQVDFHDLEGATDKIVEFAQENPLDTIVSTDDDGVVLAAMASDALGLTHSPMVAVRAARDKYHTRQALTAAGMRTPEYLRFSVDDDPSEIAQQVSYPCVVKPLALAASRGVMRADDPEQFVVAFERLVSILRGVEHGDGTPVGDQILVEGFIPGAEVAVEGMLIAGELLVLAIFDKPDPLDGPYFEETIYVTPSRHPQEVQAEIVDATGQAVAALGLTEGPIHAEMRVNEQGAWILEVAPRSIGGYCSRALRFGSDATLEELILQQALGHPLNSTEPASPASGVMMIPIPKAGILCEMQGVASAQEVPGIEEIRLTIPVGQAVVPLPEGSQYLGFIFSRAENPERAEAALRQAHARLNFVILPPDEADSHEPGETAVDVPDFRAQNKPN